MPRTPVTFFPILLTAAIMNGSLPIATAKPADPLSAHLPEKVWEVVQARSPSDRIWRIERAGNGANAVYDVTLFNPNTPATHGQLVEGVMVYRLLQHHIVLKVSGQVIREDSHSIAMKSLPNGVREAYAKWRQTIPQDNELLDVRVQQLKGNKRTYLFNVILSAVKSHQAVFYSDGSRVPGPSNE